jgi:hypothetical protein
MILCIFFFFNYQICPLDESGRGKAVLEAKREDREESEEFSIMKNSSRLLRFLRDLRV